MKALTGVTLTTQEKLRVTHPYEDFREIWQRAQPNTRVEVETVNGHGGVKRTTLVWGTILRLEEL